MGKYINQIGTLPTPASYEGKCKFLESNGAVKCSDLRYLPNMICVIDNGFFAAAAYAYNESEYEEFKQPDGRPKQWYTLDNAEEYAK
jgi:hypothetical protein|tara:strand:+ start:1036 stop:1296 length:261 start_codon:yes stop_codon:yes gene_type:complete